MIFSKKQIDTIISWRHDFDMMNVRNCDDVCHPQGLHESRLNYDIAQVNRTENTQWFFDFIKNYLEDLYPGNSVDKGEFFYLHKWSKGDKFTKHIDKRRDQSWALVVGASLNTDYEGGKLIAYNPQEELATKVGELYVMDTNRLHEVTEVTSGLRYSFVYFVPIQLLNKQESLL